MININELPTMDFHFFESPNKIIISDKDYHIIITAELDFEFDFDFILDAQSFNMLKKLGGPITIENNTIQFNKYKCQNIFAEKPSLFTSEIIYKNDYNLTELKEATKFISYNYSQMSLCGVLLNDCGDIFGTDSFKFYYKRKNLNLMYNKIWSVPKNFIDLLPNEEIVNLQFTYKKIIYNGLYKMYSNLYNSDVPAIEKVCNEFQPLYYNTITNNEQLTYLPCEKILIKNGSKFIFNDNEKEFTVDFEKTDFELECKISYEHFMQALQICGNQLFIEYGNKSLRINKKIIICYMR